MKIFITGGSGFLGQYLNIELSKHHTVMTQYNTKSGNCIEFESVQLDLTDLNKVRTILYDYKPDVVIHTAAKTSTISKSGINPGIIYKLNVDCTEFLAQICERINAKMIYTSTDLVYAGYRGLMLKEDAKLIPVSLYAETKLMGEVKIQNTFDNYIILRTALLYGFGLNHSNCHFHKMYDDLKKGKEVKLFVDQFRTPLSVIETARMINELVTKNIKTEIINFGGLERVSRYELGGVLCDAAGFDKNLLVKIKLDDMPDLPKVEDVSMGTDKLQSFGIAPKGIESSITNLLNFQ